MCIRDRNGVEPHAARAGRLERVVAVDPRVVAEVLEQEGGCLLYTSDAADDLPCVDLGGSRLIKKKHAQTSTTNIIHT